MPNAKLPEVEGKTYTYSCHFREELAMLTALKDDPRSHAAISLAAWSGVSSAELEALRWEDLHDGYLHAKRAVVEGDMKATKTEYRKDAVPIIPLLEYTLIAYYVSVGSPAKG